MTFFISVANISLVRFNPQSLWYLLFSMKKLKSLQVSYISRSISIALTLCRGAHTPNLHIPDQEVEESLTIDSSVHKGAGQLQNKICILL